MRITRRRVGKVEQAQKEFYIIQSHMDAVVKAINSIGFGTGLAGGAENIDCDYANVEFATAGTEVTGSHALKRIPIGFILIKSDRAGDIYVEAAATSANFYLKSDSDNLSGVVLII